MSSRPSTRTGYAVAEETARSLHTRAIICTPFWSAATPIGRQGRHERLIPFLSSGGLFALWLLLNQTFSIGHILLGGVIAVVGGWTHRPRTPENPSAAHWRDGAVAAVVLIDIVGPISRSRALFWISSAARATGFIKSARITNPYGLATLACIITSTPGTIWVDFDEARGLLTIHVLDLTDRDDGERHQGYERRLLECA